MAKDLSFIDESILDVVPEAFKNLDPEATYRLEKTGSTRENIFVGVGDRVQGEIRIINVLDRLGPGVRVSSGFRNYIRTSPIVAVLSSTDTEIKFQTEGGFYTLTKMAQDANPSFL